MERARLTRSNDTCRLAGAQAVTTLVSAKKVNAALLIIMVNIIFLGCLDVWASIARWCCNFKIFAIESVTWPRISFLQWYVIRLCEIRFIFSLSNVRVYSSLPITGTTILTRECDETFWRMCRSIVNTTGWLAGREVRKSRNFLVSRFCTDWMIPSIRSLII